MGSSWVMCSHMMQQPSHGHIRIMKCAQAVIVVMGGQVPQEGRPGDEALYCTGNQAEREEKGTKKGQREGQAFKQIYLV